MHLKSMFPDVPAHPPVNIHHCLFNRPDQREWKDFTVHIDGLTGERRSFRQFKQRVVDGATALSADVGVDLTGPDEIVGILSENCMVRREQSTHRAPLLMRDAGLLHADTIAAIHSYTLHHVFALLHSL